MFCLAGLLAVTLCGALAAPALAQTPTEPAKPEIKPEPEHYVTIRLVNMIQQHEANDVVTDLRNVLPKSRIYYVAAQNTLSVKGSAEDLELARKIVAELDQPPKSYRVSFTLSEVEAGKRLTSRKFSLALYGGERSVLKQGQRVPIVTGADKKDSDTGVQVQYVDIGLSLQANIDGKRLSTKVEESAIVAGSGLVPNHDPSIDQTVLEGSSTLKLGVPVVLGTLDVPGSAHRQEVEVLVEAIE
jgi:type II secretory pathway component GspD/PulD (secretin)